MRSTDEKIHVVMAADGSYVNGLKVAKASMVESCGVPSRLEFHLFGADDSLAERIRREFGTYKGSPMSFLRLYLGELLPDVDWVVYSDVDTLWRRDVAELWDLRDETKTVQWVGTSSFEFVDWCARRGVSLEGFSAEKYGCCGVMLVNLAQMRARRVLERCRDFAARHGVPKYADQDVLNAVLAGTDEIGMLPGAWDVIIPTPETPRACVLHVTGVGRCFAAPYRGRIAQYRYWDHLARGGGDGWRTWSPPFYLRAWMVRLLLPFAGGLFRERVVRHFAWRWWVAREARNMV
ncbi:MAG: hypothetical protein IJ829_08870 [Kiritimatiellae bacterium]|nr:hypothetical protein [Kiritimatiellia bacterium]